MSRDLSPWALQRKANRDSALSRFNSEQGTPGVPPHCDYGRREKAWKIGFGAVLAGMSTEARDYYSAENFYAGMRHAFRYGRDSAKIYIERAEAAKP